MGERTNEHEKRLWTDPGPADGVMGPLTKQGLQVYQQQGLEPTGNLNERTLNALEIETEEFMGLAPAFE